MGVILDTSVLIEAERRKFEIDTFTENRDEEIFGLSVISVAELLHGVHRADSTKRRLKRSAYVEKIIELFDRTVADDSLHSHIHVRLFCAEHRRIIDLQVGIFHTDGSFHFIHYLSVCQSQRCHGL